jgi:hypothetical protein
MSNTPQGQTYESAVGSALYGENAMAPRAAPETAKTYDNQVGNVLYGNVWDQIPGAAAGFATPPKIAPAKKLATQKAKKK